MKMKKWITWIAMLAIAGIATAQIADGDFTGAGLVGTSAANYNGTTGGWVGHSTTETIYDTANDRVQFTSGGSFRVLSQVIKASEFGEAGKGSYGASDTILRVAYDVEGAGVDLEVRIWGDEGSFGWNAGSRMYDITVAGGDTSQVLLGTGSLVDIGTSTGSLDVDLNLAQTLDNYAMIWVGVSIKGADGDNGYITSVHFVGGAEEGVRGSFFVIK